MKEYSLARNFCGTLAIKSLQSPAKFSTHSVGYPVCLQTKEFGVLKESKKKTIESEKNLFV